MTKKQKIILIIVASLIVLIPLFIWGVSSLGNTLSNNDSIIKDVDTGETINKAEPIVQTGGDGINTSKVVLFGIEPLIERLYEQEKPTAYIASVKQALWNFSKNRLEDKYETITLRPQELVFGSSEITGTIRLGQTDTILPISIKPSMNSKQAVITINEGGSQFRGTYVYIGGLEIQDALLYTITQKDDHVSDLEIKTYEGYRDPALMYIKSLGYNVYDFVINFSNYENPFDEK